EAEPAPIPRELGIDDALEKIVMKGLEKKPANRWPDMRTMGMELAHWLDARGVREDVSGASIRATWLAKPPASDAMTTAAARRPSRRTLRVAALALVMLMVVFAAFRRTHRARADVDEKPSPAPPSSVARTEELPKAPDAI